MRDSTDNCPFDGNPAQQDADADGTGDACDFAASGVDLRSRIPLRMFPDSQGLASDIWHYTSPAGGEYAIIGLEKGVAFVRVTDPGAAAIVGYVNSGESTMWRDMATFGSHAYLVSEQLGMAGLQIVDLSGIDANQVTLVNTTSLGIGFKRSHNVFVNENTGTLYLATSNLNNRNGIPAMDLNADPVNPTFLGAWSDAAPDVSCHDLQVVSYTEGPFAGQEIAFCFAENDGLRIVDVSDKGNMFLISSLSHPTWRYTHQGWLSGDAGYLFVNDESDEAAGTVPGTTTYVVNVQDLNSPFLATTFTTGLSTIDHNLMVRGKVLYEANYNSGLHVFDVCNPENPQATGFFDTYPPDDNLEFAGAWGVSSGLPSSTILISDIQGGLFVLDACYVALRCTVGADVDRTCDACVDAVCTDTKRCCQSNWNASCVELVRTVCGSLVCEESAGSCSHTLCEEGPALTAGCDSPPASLSCVQEVCAVQPECCSVAWGASCVEALESVCGANCD